MTEFKTVKLEINKLTRDLTSVIDYMSNELNLNKAEIAIISRIICESVERDLVIVEKPKGVDDKDIYGDGV